MGFYLSAGVNQSQQYSVYFGTLRHFAAIKKPAAAGCGLAVWMQVSIEAKGRQLLFF